VATVFGEWSLPEEWRRLQQTVRKVEVEGAGGRIGGADEVGMQGDQGLPHVQAEIARNGLHAGDDPDTHAAVQQGPAGKVQLRFFLPFALDEEGAPDELFGILQGIDVIEMDDGLGRAALLEILDKQSKLLQIVL